MPSKSWVVPIVMLALAALACSGLPAATVLFKDDFSDSSGGWKFTSSSTYQDGQLLLRLDEANTLIKTLINAPALSNVHVEFAVQNSGRVSDELFGAICDYKDDGQAADYYFLGIGTDGYYAIGKSVKSELTVLVEGNSDRFTDDTAAYRVGADCGGGNLTLTVEGEQVATAADTTYSQGDAGLFLASGKKPTAEASYDDFVVKTLK
jgi:hypothetical protein